MRWEEGGGGVEGHMGKVGGGEEEMEVRFERRRAWDSKNCGKRGE